MRIERPKATIVAAWMVTIGMVIAAVEPVLPAETPTWVRTALAILAVVLAAALRSPVVRGDRTDDDPPMHAGSRRRTLSRALTPRERPEPPQRPGGAS